MKTITLLILIICGNICYGQDTLYFDSNWKTTTKANAEYFRVDKKEANKWSRTDYYKSNQIQMKGTYTSLSPEIEEGYFEWYHPNGVLKHKGNYLKGKSIDQHLWYRDNGNIEAIENYKNGKLHGQYEEYFPNGKLMNKASFVDGAQEGWAVYYREDGTIASEGNFTKGNRNGEWKFYDESGKLEGTTIFKIDYEIPEANIFFQLPNDQWRLTAHTGTSFVQYIFKRNEIKDSKGRAIIPAIMLYIEDASSYKGDLVTYSIEKRLQFSKINLKINNKILIPTDNDFPFPSMKNAMIITASYTEKEFEHVFYMVYIITKDNKGVQLYMDITKDIADGYEKEFWTLLKSIKQLN